MKKPTIKDITDSQNILDAMHEVENGVRWKASVQRFEINKLRRAAEIRRSLGSGNYKPLKTTRFDMVERGKLRHIQAQHVRDRAIQKIICNQALKPTVYPCLIYDNSASQKGKGTEFALKRLKEHLRWHIARYGKTGVIVITDLHDYFNSIPHGQVAAAMTKHIDDAKIRKYVRIFIDEYDGPTGLGLGSETSQIGAICYTNTVDRIVKEKHGIHCYGRYMDDSYFICADRKEAVECLADMREELGKLGLTVNEKKTVVHNIASDDFEYLKKRIHIEDSGKIIFRLTRKNISAERKRIDTHRKKYDEGRITADYIAKSYITWRGYAKKYYTYKTVGAMDRYFAETMKGTTWAG